MFCTLCLFKNNENALILLKNEQELVHNIFLCVGIKIFPSDLTHYICKKCIERVKDWLEFKCTCERSLKWITEQNNEKVCNKSLQIENELENRNKSNLDTLSIEISLVETNNDSDEKTTTLKNQVESTKIKNYKKRKIGKKEVKSIEKATCTICNKIMLKKSLNVHINKHLQKFKCKLCGFCSSTNNELEQHNKSVHLNIKGNICDICNNSYSTKSSLKLHKKLHLNERLYKCKKCSFRGNTASSLYSHNLSVHSVDNIKCDICFKEFKSKKNLTDHKTRAHAKEKMHVCSYCNLKFLYKNILMKHMHVHTGIRPFACKICSKSFIRSDALKYHMRVHDTDRNFKCDSCMKTFLTTKGLKGHICKVLQVHETENKRCNA